MVPLWLLAGDDWEAIPRGALAELLHTWNFEALPDAQTVENTIAYYQDMLAKTFIQWSDQQPYYARAALLKSQSLIAYWPLWEPVGATLARDRGGYAYDGTPVGHTWNAAGIGDGMTSVYLPLTAARIAGFPAALRSALNMDVGSLSLWADSNDWTQTAFQYHFSAYTSSPSLQFNLRKDSGLTYSFFLKPPGLTAVQITASIAAWAMTGKHHIGATWDINADVVLRLDGTEVARAAHPGSFGGTVPVQLSLGSLGSPFGGCNGRLAHVALFDSVLSDEEMTYLARV